MAQSGFAGMTVNERLYLAGLLPSFNDAARVGNRSALIDLVSQVDLADQAPAIADAILSRSDIAVLHRRNASPRRLNRAGREIWFKRVLWSYWPCHWKGSLLTATVVAVVVPSAFILQGLFPNPDWIAALPLMTGIIAAWVISERHSP